MDELFHFANSSEAADIVVILEDIFRVIVLAAAAFNPEQLMLKVVAGGRGSR